MSTEKELLKGNTPTLVLAVLRDGPPTGMELPARSSGGARTRSSARKARSTRRSTPSSRTA